MPKLLIQIFTICSLTAPTLSGLSAMESHRDLSYVNQGRPRQNLDLYLPDKDGPPKPLIIWVHGGGWKGGDKRNCLPLTRGFVESGYAVASLNYRLSGDAIFPAQIEDCKAAIRWLRANAEKYHLDPERFGVWGSSAGGHLVALLGTSSDVKIWDSGPHPDQSSAVQAVCDFYGPTDFLQMQVRGPAKGHMGHDAPDSPESLLIGGPIQENPDKAAKTNPITYVTASDPPFLIIHGDQDGVVPIHQSELLYESLKKAGVPVHFHTIEGAGHGQGFGGAEITEKVAAFFDRTLKAAKDQKTTNEATTSRSKAQDRTDRPFQRPGPGKQENS